MAIRLGMACEGCRMAGRAGRGGRREIRENCLAQRDGAAWNGTPCEAFGATGGQGRTAKRQLRLLYSTPHLQDKGSVRLNNTVAYKDKYQTETEVEMSDQESSITREIIKTTISGAAGGVAGAVTSSLIGG